MTSIDSNSPSRRPMWPRHDLVKIMTIAVFVTAVVAALGECRLIGGLL